MVLFAFIFFLPRLARPRRYLNVKSTCVAAHRRFFTRADKKWQATVKHGRKFSLRFFFFISFFFIFFFRRVPRGNCNKCYEQRAVSSLACRCDEYRSVLKQEGRKKQVWFIEYDACNCFPMFRVQDGTKRYECVWRHYCTMTWDSMSVNIVICSIIAMYVTANRRK